MKGFSTAFLLGASITTGAFMLLKKLKNKPVKQTPTLRTRHHIKKIPTLRINEDYMSQAPTYRQANEIIGRTYGYSTLKVYHDAKHTTVKVPIGDLYIYYRLWYKEPYVYLKIRIIKNNHFVNDQYYQKVNIPKSAKIRIILANEE